jgi:hypothetical protein
MQHGVRVLLAPVSMTTISKVPLPSPSQPVGCLYHSSFQVAKTRVARKALLLRSFARIQPGRVGYATKDRDMSETYL